MLIAVDKKGEIIWAGNTVEGECYCPACRRKVIHRKGQINIPHFAHVHKDSCSALSEGETMEHLKGKTQLYQWLKKEGIAVELEPYLPELKQRPDLLIIYQGEKIAIEFQCSPLSKKVITYRTQGYREKGYTVLWFLGGKLKVHARLTGRQKTFLKNSKKGGVYLLQLNTEAETVDIFSNLYGTGSKATHEKATLTWNNSAADFCLEIERPPKKHKEKRLNKTGVYRELARMSHYKQNRSRRFFELLYETGESVSTIPDTVYQSVSSEWMIKTLPCQWKYQLLLVIKTYPKNKVITLNGIKRMLHEWERAGQISYYCLPNIDRQFYYKPVIEFFALLESTHRLKKVGEYKWRVPGDEVNSK